MQSNLACHPHGGSKSIDSLLFRYDEVVLSLKRAAVAISIRDPFLRQAELARAMAILDELRIGLNQEADGAFARRVELLYNYLIERISAADVLSDSQVIHEVLGLVENLRGAYRELAASIRFGDNGSSVF